MHYKVRQFDESPWTDEVNFILRQNQDFLNLTKFFCAEHAALSAQYRKSPSSENERLTKTQISYYFDEIATFT